MPDFAGDTSTELERKLGPLKVVCITEAVSYLFLLTMWQGLRSHTGTLIVGSVHGMVVTAFALMVVFIYREMGWSAKFAALAIVTGPIGAVIVHERVRRQGAPVPARTKARPTMGT
jgi:hypothetical protein